jgi:hypothetical protein
LTDPANRTLQQLRGIRFLFMAVLYAGFILLDAAVALRQGRKMLEIDAQEAGAWQTLLARRYFRRDAAESVRFMPHGGMFQGGTWGDRLLGKYQAMPGMPPRLEVSEKLLAALSRANRGMDGDFSPWAVWRAKLAYQLVRQVYYYRSAEFYRMTWAARAVDKIGGAWLAAGRLPLGPFSGLSHALLARVYGEAGYMRLVLASAAQTAPKIAQASRLAQSAQAGDAQIMALLARLAGKGTEAQAREAWLALAGRIAPETAEADWLYLSEVLSRFQRLPKTDIPVMFSQGQSGRLAVPEALLRSPRDAGLLIDRLRGQFALDEDKLQPLLPRRPRGGFKESS